MFNATGPLTKCPRCGLFNASYLTRDGSDGENGYVVYNSACSCGAEYESRFDQWEDGDLLDTEILSINADCRECGEEYDATDGVCLGLCYDCRWPDSGWAVEEI